MTAPLLFALIGLALVLVIGFAALIWREPIAYYLRLLNAKRVADAFYADAPGITKNIGYGRDDREKLDVYQPAAQGNYPVIIWVHGGSWTSGSKELYATVAQKVLPENLVVVIPNYTITRQKGRIESVPLVFQQAQQIAAVVAWARENIAAYGGDPDRIIIGGHSAGAHLTGLVTLDPTYLATFNHSTDEIAGWYGISGPLSLPHQLIHERTVNRREPTILFELFGGQDNFHRGSPHAHVRENVPPILLIHGDQDETVPLAVAKNMHSALQQLGASSELKIYPDTTHVGILFDALPQQKPQLVQDIVAFAKSCLPISIRQPKPSNHQTT